ncbi:MAG: aconitate hydratase [Chloroflexi bacterium]|nr:aconitate hydratase [Chloroflexota bacterium]
MGQSLAHKLISSHLVSGDLVPGKEIALRVDQTLIQDATGTMADLQFEAMGVPRVNTKLSVSYVDHNMLQTGFESADDHRFLQSIAAKYGMVFSKPGNGICHQVHLERFGAPGLTLLGSDSHTCNAGADAMLAIGAGGLDVAVAMAGRPYYLPMPRVTLVKLRGQLRPWAASKDIILEVLRQLTVKGGTGRVMEYGGEGVATLTVPQRATVANMGAELGATTTVFPSDEQTHAYLLAQGRGHAWEPLAADPDAAYDDVLEIDLSSLEPLIARPQSPDNVCKVRDVEGTPVAQVALGSCNNSGFQDVMTVAGILRGKGVPANVSLVVTPGSMQTLINVYRSGALLDLINAGARILECACGPCIGMGQAPPSNAVSVRTMNRNFAGRSGTADDRVYLASPEVAAASALSGAITDPRRLGDPVVVKLPRKFVINDDYILPPSAEPDKVEIIRGPNIKPLPLASPPDQTVAGQVLIVVGDNVSTDHILPAGAKVLPLRSNIPAIAEYVFERVDPDFVRRTKQIGGGIIVGGTNYGQGSSREHAALAPMYLGVKAVLAKSFARIHWSNLVNFGILPLTFTAAQDYVAISQGDTLDIPDVASQIRKGKQVTVRNRTKGTAFQAEHALSPRQVEIILAGGLLNYIRQGKD